MFIGDRVVNRVAPRERDIAMVFQDYALYPQMTVFDNLAFGLRRRQACAREEISRRVDEAARVLGHRSRCWSASRGSSRAARRSGWRLGRALVRDPQVFLMDEPLSNLDAKLRTQTRGEIRRIAAGGRHDHGLRHARPGRGDDDGRPDRGHERRRARAGRDAGGDLRAAGEPLRGRVHRLAGDELLGAVCRGRAWPARRGGRRAARSTRGAGARAWSAR